MRREQEVRQARQVGSACAWDSKRPIQLPRLGVYPQQGCFRELAAADHQARLDHLSELLAQEGQAILALMWVWVSIVGRVAVDRVCDEQVGLGDPGSLLSAVEDTPAAAVGGFLLFHGSGTRFRIAALAGGDRR
jgi:hypothetical protein